MLFIKSNGSYELSEYIDPSTGRRIVMGPFPTQYPNQMIGSVKPNSSYATQFFQGTIVWNTMTANTDVMGWVLISATGTTGLVWQPFGPLLYEGAWSITTGSVLTAATASYSKIGKQVALSGTLTFATAATAVAITLPYAPDYGGTITFGNLTFVLTSGSTSATVSSSVITTAQTFQLNYKTA